MLKARYIVFMLDGTVTVYPSEVSCYHIMSMCQCMMHVVGIRRKI